MKRPALSSNALALAALTLTAFSLAGAQTSVPRPSVPGSSAPAPSAAPARAPSVATSNTYTAPGYTFVVAGGWLSLKNSQGNAALAGPAAEGKLNPSFTVIVTEIPKDVRASLGVARDVRAEELPTLVKNFKMLGEKSVKVGPRGAQGVLWTYTGTDQGAPFRWTQLLSISGGKLYTVTLAIPDGTLPQVATAGRAMFDSFNFR
ncbi:hypothetical protein [Deinococcus petrolearius]|uniref:Uncharacterized protein n=1 Tax=Deinococcus petrolearius TaxID=1751295 RepID=A0ABW1DK80_9DEIO